MINWIIIALLLAVGFLIIRFSHMGKKVKLVIVVILIILLYTSATSLLSKNNVKLDSIGGIGKAISLYFTWLGNAAQSIWHMGGQVKSGIGNVVKTNISEYEV